MDQQGTRRMYGHRNGLQTRQGQFLLVVWILMLANLQQNVCSDFLGDIKAVLSDCKDHWTLKGNAPFPLLYRMTVCVNVRVVEPGPWVAFTYSSVHGLMPELGLEGDQGALYVWLLRVRHRFPMQLSLWDWHQVCLRRDVVGSSFSLEVDGLTVGHRVVIAEAIPSHGSLWLGCGQRDRPQGAALGLVELYLFRMWADLHQHQACEDGSVIGWRSDYWGVTSPMARQRDDNLPCAVPSTSAPLSGQAPTPDLSSELICHIEQLCSTDMAYFWIPVTVTSTEEVTSEKDIHYFMSSVFSCGNKGSATQSGFDRFCQEVTRLEVVTVSCIIDEDNRSRCGVVLQLSPSVSACELHQAGLSALQQATDRRTLQAALTGDVERVGRNLCDGVGPSSDGFVTCTSSSSLEELCRSRDRSLLTCAVIKPDHVLNKPVTSNSCTEEEAHTCDCSSFCDGQRYFYAQLLNAADFSLDDEFLQNLLKTQVMQTCAVAPNSECIKALDVLQSQGLRRTHVDCQKIDQRSYSCRMILEMTKPITDCSVITVLQTLLNGSAGVSTEGPLAPLVVCSDRGKSINSLLTSNLTWFQSNLHKSEVCEKGQNHLKCASNENLAVLLSDTCSSQLTTALPLIKETPSPTTTAPYAAPSATTPMSTEAVPVTTGKTTSTTPRPTVVGDTSTHNTEATRKQSTDQLELTTLESSVLSNTTLKTPNAQTVPPTRDAFWIRETSVTATQSLTKFTEASRKVSISTITNKASAPPSASTGGEGISDDKTTTEAFPTKDTTIASLTSILRVTGQLNTASLSTANTNDFITARITKDKANTASTISAISANNHRTDSSTKGDVASSATAKTFNSITSSNVETTGRNAANASTFGNRAEAYSIAKNLTAHPTSAATINEVITKANITSLTEASSTKTSTAATAAVNSYQPYPSQTINLQTTNSNTGVTSSPHTLPTTRLDSFIETTSTSGTVQTTPKPTTATVTGRILSTTPSETVATTRPTPTTSTSETGGVSASLQSTPMGGETTHTPNQFISDLTTAKAKKGTATSTQTSVPGWISTNSHTTPQGPRNLTPPEASPFVSQTSVIKLTSPTTLEPISNGSSVRKQTTIETDTPTTQASSNPTTVALWESIVITRATNAQGSPMTTTMSPSSVTTSSNIPIKPISNDTGVSKMEDKTSSTAAPEQMFNNTFVATIMASKSSLRQSTPPYTPDYNATMSHATATTAATTNTPTTTQGSGYKVTKVTVSPTSAILSKKTTARYGTTVGNININLTTIPQNESVSTKDDVTEKEETTSVVFESPTASTQAGMTASDMTAHVSTPDLNETRRSTSPTRTPTTTSTDKPHSTPEVTIPGAALSPQPSTITSTVSLVSTEEAPAGVTTGVTVGPRPTYERTSTKTEASRTTPTQSTQTRRPQTFDVESIRTTTVQAARSKQELEEEADRLLSQMEGISQLNSSQVSKLVGQLERLLDGPTVSQAVGKKALNIISNLMGRTAEALSASANRLIRLVDALGLKLEVAGENEILSASHLVLAVQRVDPSNFSVTNVNIFNPDNVQINKRGAKSSGAPLGSVFLPSSLTERLGPEEKQRAARVQFTFHTKTTLFQDSTLNNNTLVSPVLGSSVADLSITKLRENIRFTIRNVEPIDATLNYSTLCVFWDFTENGGDGGWSNVGCHVVSVTPEATTCSCNHLTSFAVLLDFSREGIKDHEQAKVLTFITYIGCGVSAVFLSITILTYLSFEKLLRDIPAKILVQLCISLLLLNLVFLVDGWLALHKVDGLCISTAFFLHYFLLTSFTWAGLEALHMYLSIVRVFTPYLSKYMMKFSIMGWGIPLIVVVIIIAVDKNNYGLVSYGYKDGTTDDFCWLRDDTAFYVGVVAYFLLIFTLCLVVFVVVLVQLARIKRQNPQNQNPNRGVLSDLRSISGLIVLLGLTWGFALFAWGQLYLPFVYLFCIFNSLQGLFIFVFHCAVKENVQRQWRTYLCCGKLRLPENSEWSRTATHYNKNTSFALMTTSAARLASSSSSVISETNSSGSAYADSGISDGSTCDVVLNEIHRRNMARQGQL